MLIRIRTVLKVSQVGVGGLIVMLLSGCSSPTAKPGTALFEPNSRRPLYPYSPTNDLVDTYHGVPVADPYRWLESDWSPATEAWVAAQTRLTRAMLDSIPERAWIRSRLSRWRDVERQSLPVQRGERLFYLSHHGAQSERALSWQDGEAGPVRVLVDPDPLASVGRAVLSGFEPNPDGTQVAYGVSEAGATGETWRVRDVASGQDLADAVQSVNLSTVAWRIDGAGFFYSRPDDAGSLDDPSASQPAVSMLCFHQLGTLQTNDAVILHRPDRSEWRLLPQVTDDGRYLVITVVAGTDSKEGILVLDLAAPDAAVTEVLMDFDASYRFVGNDGSRFFFQTDAGAPLGRLIALNLDRPERSAWEELVSEGDDLLEAVTRVGDRFILRYLQQAVSRVALADLEGRIVAELGLPGLGSVAGFRGSSADRATFFSFTSFTTPTTLYRYDLDQRTTAVWHAPRLDFDPAAYETRQVVVRSRDGTLVPMFLSHRKGLAMDGNRPTLLQGFGGFGVNMKPRFSVAQMVWMEMGGVYAVPNLRGGGEFGEAWHRAGQGVHKQKVVDDLIAAAEWLIASEVTSPRRLAIMGTGNGGMVVGACLTQRPGLFAVALPSAGVFDLLRFARFTIGWAWVSEYGDVGDPEAFRVLLGYSPLHNVREGTVYPSTLLTTAAHDQFIVSGHSYKFAAALQAAHAGDNPVLIRILPVVSQNTEGPVDPSLEEAADQLAFAVKELGITLPNPMATASQP